MGGRRSPNQTPGRRAACERGAVPSVALCVRRFGKLAALGVHQLSALGAYRAPGTARDLYLAVMEVLSPSLPRGLLRFRRMAGEQAVAGGGVPRLRSEKRR